MRFGPVPLIEAEGAILAHSVRLESGRITKGTVLQPGHLADLDASGATEIVVARLDPGDIGEDAAATRLAAAIAGPGIVARPASTGRVNLYAQGPGLVVVDKDKVNALNAIDPMITLATVAKLQRVGAGGMVATVKIIAYAVAEAALTKAARSGTAALRLAPPIHPSATLIETTTDGSEPTPKGRRAIADRLARFDATLTDPRVVTPHRADDVATALASATGEILLILTASATSDIRDTAPEALRRAGGEITHFGMPVDPGNLLFLGHLGQKPVIGLPGCARSPALNGADWVLERVLCGIGISGADIMGMGVGGLLKDIPERGRRREP